MMPELTAAEYARATMPRVGGGEDFVFVPSWELPFVVCSPPPGGDVGNSRSGYWTCTVEAQSSDVVVGCEWCCGVSERSSRFKIHLDGHYPAHCPRFSVTGSTGAYLLSSPRAVALPDPWSSAVLGDGYGNHLTRSVWSSSLMMEEPD